MARGECSKGQLWWWPPPLSLALRRLKPEDCCKFKDNLRADIAGYTNKTFLQKEDGDVEFSYRSQYAIVQTVHFCQKWSQIT